MGLVGYMQAGLLMPFLEPGGCKEKSRFDYMYEGGDRWSSR